MKTKSKQKQEEQKKSHTVSGQELFVNDTKLAATTSSPWKSAVMRLKGREFQNLSEAVSALAGEVEMKLGVSPETAKEESELLEMLIKSEPAFEQLLRSELRIKE